MKTTALKRITSTLLTLFLLVSAGSVKAYAAPNFTLTPTTGTYTNGSSFSVVLGADSGTEKVVAMDVVGTFDATRLEITSIEKASSPAFNFEYTSSTAIIHNDTGKFEVTLAPTGSSVYDGVVVNGSLLVINFTTKATGTASLNLTCQSGSVVESNIINQASSDVVDCASNQSGSYAIVAASSGEAEATSTPTPTLTSETAANTPTSAELPRTGGVESTVGLMIFGVAVAGCALFLRFL